MISPLVRTDRAAYYFVRLDTINEISGHDWLLITYIPEEAAVNKIYSILEFILNLGT